MDMRIIAPGIVLAFTALVIPAVAQDVAQSAKVRYVSLVGTVEKVDTEGKALTVKPDKADGAAVKFDEKTQFLRLPAGETDQKKATRAAASDVSVGDRVIARLRAGEEGQPAVFLYFTKQNDLAQRKEKTLEEWQKDGVSGLVKSVDSGAKQIVISVRGGGPPKDVTLDVAGSVDYQRFSPDTGKYEPGTLASIQEGDQVRVLGLKNPDQTSIKAEAIMSGLFKTLPLQIKSIDLEAKQIVATDLASKKPITINIVADTSMKKLDDATALQMARRLNPTFQGGGGRGQGRGGAPDGAQAGGDNPSPDSPRAAAGGNGSQGGQGRAGRGGGGRNLDIGKVIEQQPAITLADLKAGEPIVVVGAASNDMSKMRAMTLVAGVDPILRAAPQNGPDPLGGNWNFGGGGDLAGGGAQ
jgi:hypothetical protein